MRSDSGIESTALVGPSECEYRDISLAGMPLSTLNLSVHTTRASNIVHSDAMIDLKIPVGDSEVVRRVLQAMLGMQRGTYHRGYACDVQLK